MYSCGGAAASYNELWAFDYQLGAYVGEFQSDFIPPPPLAYNPSTYYPVPPGNFTQLDRAGVVWYADTYSNNGPVTVPYPFNAVGVGSVNPTSGDCTNFVSSAWHVGGKLPMMDTWRDRAGWTHLLDDRDITNAWAGVTDFVNYWNGRTENVGGFSVRLLSVGGTLNNNTQLIPGALPGDIIEYETTAGWDHLAVVVGNVTNYVYNDYTNGKLAPPTGFFNGTIVDGHSNNRYHMPWNVEQLEGAPMKRARLLHWTGNTGAW